MIKYLLLLIREFTRLSICQTTKKKQLILQINSQNFSSTESTDDKTLANGIFDLKHQKYNFLGYFLIAKIKLESIINMNIQHVNVHDRTAFNNKFRAPYFPIHFVTFTSQF